MLLTYQLWLHITPKLLKMNDAERRAYIENDESGVLGAFLSKTFWDRYTAVLLEIKTPPLNEDPPNQLG